MYSPGPINALSKDRNACRSGAGHWRSFLPQSLCQTNPKLRTNKLDIERPDSCIRRPAAETHADRGRLSLNAFAKPKASQISPRTVPGIAARTARDHLVVEDAGDLAKHCAATVPDVHDVEEPDSKPTRPQCRGLRHFPKLLEAGTHHESRSWLLDLPLGWRVLRVATIVLMGPVQKRLVAPTRFVTDFQHRSSPLGGGLRTTGFMSAKVPRA